MTPTKPIVSGSHKTKSQSEKFRELARELGVDESETAFDAKLAKLGKHKPEPLAEAEKPSDG